jgi:hypothetical protein
LRFTTGETDIKGNWYCRFSGYCWTNAIRAINPKDPAFGFIADGVDAELKKLAKKSASNKKTK